MALTEAQTQEMRTQQSQSQSQDVDALPGHNQKGKFDHLLKPIKNISLSWGINIAAELSSYAASLGIALDAANSEGHQVDFAEAALLLQGSTTIYCRKIEHLYTLVLSAVEVVNQAKSRKSRPASDDGDNHGAASDDDDSCWISDELNFLSLDIPALDENQINRRERDSGTFRNAGNDTTLLVEVPHLLRTPSCADGADVNGNGTVRMNMGTVDESGALLLRGAKEMNIDLSAVAMPGANTSPKKPGTPSTGAHVPLSFEDDDYDHAPSPEFLRTGVSPLPFNMDENAHALGLAAAHPPPKSEKPWLEPQQPPAARERERADPFLELDPHDDMGIPARPVRMRSTISRPRPPRKDSEDVDEGCLADSILGPLPVKGSSNKYVSFQALREPVAKVAKKRVAMKRMRPALAVVRIADVELDKVEEGDCGGDLFGDAGLFGGDDEGYGSGGDGGVDSSPLLSLGDDVGISGIGEDMEIPTYNRGILGTDRYWQDVVDSYQSACKRYMQETTNLWEKQVVNADLVERVEKWRKKIRPALALEEKRPPYDIQGYGDNVLHRLTALEQEDVAEEKSTMIDMKTALQANDQFEVCRMFLATLQLANNYDVEICQDEDDSTDRLSPKIKLLNSTRVADIRRPPGPPGGGSVQLSDTNASAMPEISTPPRLDIERVPLADKTPKQLVNDENIRNIPVPQVIVKEPLPKIPRKNIKRKRTRASVATTPVSKRRTIRTRTYLR